MAFGQTPLDGSSTPIPMSSAVPDGTNTPLAVEGGPSKTTGGNSLAPVAVYQYDGYDVTQGTTTDAAVTGDTSGTQAAKVRGLNKMLADMWDSVNHWLQVKVMNTVPVSGTVTANIDSTNSTHLANIDTHTPALGAAVTASSTPVTIASDQTVPMNVKQYNGVAVGATNPQITQEQIRALIANGQGFRATTTYLATGAANAFIGLQLINNNQSKNIVIYNVIVSGNSSMDDCRIYQAATATADSGLTATPSIGNQQPPNGTTSVATIAGSPTATTETTGMQGTQYASFAVSANSSTYALQNSSQVYLPKSATSSAGIYAKVPTSGNSASITIEWVEF